MGARELIIMAIIGIVAGWLASIVMGGSGLIRYLITGLIGSLVGGILVNALNINLNIGGPLGTQIIVATVGAIIVIALARLVA